METVLAKNTHPSNPVSLGGVSLECGEEKMVPVAMIGRWVKPVKRADAKKLATEADSKAAEESASADEAQKEESEKTATKKKAASKKAPAKKVE